MAVWNRFPEEKKAEALAMRAAGAHRIEIHKKTGASEKVQRRWEAEAGVSKGPRKVYPKRLLERCKELRLAGGSLQEIHKKTGVPREVQRELYGPELRRANTRRRQLRELELKKKREETKRRVIPPSVRRVKEPPTQKFQGLEYKIGVHGKLFYRTSKHADWHLSTLRPATVGLT